VPGPPAGQPPNGPGAPGAGTVDPNGAVVPGVASADDAAGIISGNPGADLYPQPPVEPATTVQSLLVARLNEVQHRVQYLRNVLVRTRADLAVAQAQLDSAGVLINLLVGPATTAPSGGAVDGPQGRVLALSAAIASGEADLARSEGAVQTLQQQVNAGVQTVVASAPVAPAGPPGGAAGYGGGKLRRPVNGPITSRFGNRFDPYYHVWQLHAGLDMAAAMGTELVAAAGGRVTRAGWNGGYGNYTCIDHGVFNGQRLSTCYGHQSTILVRPGQQVSAGEVIGRVGSTGASTGPHVHFEVRLGGRPVDPMPWI
jgi:murein DD-endopeptidase MepM/ murein hydrolase activator NlpD